MNFRFNINYTGSPSSGPSSPLWNWAIQAVVSLPTGGEYTKITGRSLLLLACPMPITDSLFFLRCSACFFPSVYASISTLSVPSPSLLPFAGIEWLAYGDHSALKCIFASIAVCLQVNMTLVPTIVSILPASNLALLSGSTYYLVWKVWDLCGRAFQTAWACPSEKESLALAHSRGARRIPRPAPGFLCSTSPTRPPPPS